MKKRVFALALALGLALSVPVQAAADSTRNFVRQQSYGGQFPDVPAGSVFYDNVAALYEYGLTVGREDGTFGPEESMTVGQILIFAGRIRSLYRTGDPEWGAASWRREGDAAAMPYLRYLQAEGVVGAEFAANLGRTATRAEAAHVLAQVLPEQAMPDLHGALVTQGYASRRFLTDVTEYTPYYQDILALYRKGIAAGSDSTGSFLPEEAVSRGAAAAMLTRVVDPALRTAPLWDLAAVLGQEGPSLSGLVEPGRFILSPADKRELDEAVRYMLSVDSCQLVLYDPEITLERARTIMEQALAVVKSYCEQSYNTVDCTYTADGFVTLVFSAASAGDRLHEYRAASLEAAEAVRASLWRSGALKEGMTELEKARVYYTWICEHCVYDYRAGDESLSHIAYNLFAEGTAVCDGYTGAYNLLLKLEGIQCTALSNAGHIWTVAELDGTTYHIDTTWGDTGSVISYDYFAMTPEQSRELHPW